MEGVTTPETITLTIATGSAIGATLAQPEDGAPRRAAGALAPHPPATSDRRLDVDGLPAKSEAKRAARRARRRHRGPTRRPTGSSPVARPPIARTPAPP